MCEPTDDWPYKFDKSLELDGIGMNSSLVQTVQMADCSPGVPGKENQFEFFSGPSAAEDDDEVTELKIRAFLDEKVPLFLPLDLHGGVTISFQFFHFSQ